LSIQVVFHRLAVKEARAAEAWYRSRSAEVADRFRAAVLDAAERIAANVGTHPVDASRFRYVRVQRFPYRLLPRIGIVGQGRRDLAFPSTSGVLAATEVTAGTRDFPAKT
jgi:hypothetical protein